MWLYSGKKDNTARSMYRKAVDGQSPPTAAGCMVGCAGMLDRLVFDTNPSKLVYVAEMQVKDWPLGLGLG